MLNIVLFEPEIPPNTGNIIRLCVNMGARLHLIYPLGFDVNDKQLRRAGLDYIDQDIIKHHENFDQFIATESPNNLYGFSTKATKYYTDALFEDNDYLMFGPETRGLPEDIRKFCGYENLLKLPMRVGANNRSLNLSNSVAIAAYEAWRQLSFK